MSLSGIILLASRFLGGAGERGRSRLVMAVMGVAMSVIPLVVVQQIADGMISGIVMRFIETGSYHIQAVARLTPDPDTLAVTIDQIQAQEGVRSARQERQGFGLLYSDSGRAGVTIRAVPAGFRRDDPGVQEYLEVREGEFLLEEQEQIVVGVDTAKRLGISPGDEVRLLTVKPLGEGRSLPRVSRFTVSGVVSTGYRDLDRLWVYVPLSRGLRIIPDETARDIVGIKVTDPLEIPSPLFDRGIISPGRQARQTDARRLMTTIASAFGPEWFVLDWYSMERARYISFLTSRNLLSVVMAMIVVVAGINVSSALVLLVVEKEQEIAILRATGVGVRPVGQTFLVAGLMIGTVGAAIGAALGLVIAGNINTILYTLERVISFLAGRTVDIFSSDFYLEQIPVTIRLIPLGMAILFTITTALVAAVLPARRATRVAPDRILRRSV